MAVIVVDVVGTYSRVDIHLHDVGAVQGSNSSDACVDKCNSDALPRVSTG